MTVEGNEDRPNYPILEFLFSTNGLILSFTVLLMLGFAILGGKGIRPPPGSEEYDSTESIELCDNAIRASVNNPSTLAIHRFTGYDTKVDAHNKRHNTQVFSVKNAFGLEQTFVAFCTISPKGELLDFKVVEQSE